jgi:tRNA threonylcarbamoyladenosine biosynthesis protein TsaE
MKWKIDDINDFKQVIEVVVKKSIEIANSDKKAVVIALHGNLGAGKTTFTKELARFLGIKENVTSPTYIIQKNFDISEDKQTEFEPFKKLIHIDTYRIDLQDELVKLGWSDNLLNTKNLIALEWPENIPDLLPENRINIYFTFVDEITRQVEIR